MQLTLPGFPVPPSEPLTAFLADRSLTCGPRMLKLYRHLLSKFERGLHAPPTADCYRKYLISYRKSAPDTQANLYRALRTYARWRVYSGYSTHDPFSGPGAIPRPRKPRQRRVTYTATAIARLLAASGPEVGQRRQWAADGPRGREVNQARALILLLADSALRAEEVCRLTCGQVRQETLVVLGKGGHTDRVFLTEPTREALCELAGDRPDTAPLFRDWWSGDCSVPALRGILKRVAKRAGVQLPPRPLHAFRHYCAQAWAAAGKPDVTIKRWMRHGSIVTTAIYTDGARDEDLALQHAAVSTVAALLAEAEKI